jgi:hypothetical protein
METSSSRSSAKWSLTAQSVSPGKQSPFQGSGRATQAHQVSRSEEEIGTRQPEIQKEIQGERTSPIEIPLPSDAGKDMINIGGAPFADHHGPWQQDQSGYESEGQNPALPKQPPSAFTDNSGENERRRCWPEGGSALLPSEHSSHGHDMRPQLEGLRRAV